MQHLISVIMAAYNGERYLAQALDSILAQEHVAFEVIIVDDGSTDNTSAVIKRYLAPRVTAIWQYNQGQGAAFNQAIKLAKGELIAFLDQDDIFLPNKLFLQAKILTSMPEIDIVLGGIEHFISPELSDEIKAKRDCPKQPVSGYLPSVTMLRKKCVEQVGPFNTQWQVGSYIDWCIRAKEKGLNDYILPEVLLRRRIHDKNQTVVARSHYHNYLQIIKEKLNRERSV